METPLLSVTENWLLVGLLISFCMFLVLINLDTVLTGDNWIRALHKSWGWAGGFVLMVCIFLFGIVTVSAKIIEIWKLLSLYAGVEAGFLIDHHFRFKNINDGGNC